MLIVVTFEHIIHATVPIAKSSLVAIAGCFPVQVCVAVLIKVVEAAIEFRIQNTALVFQKLPRMAMGEIRVSICEKPVCVRGS